ncbi:MAG: restriction endonuclease subunit S [Bacteroidota bacterium]
MSEWREYSILDFAEIHNQLRVPLSKMQRAKKQGIYPYYGASGIIDFVDGYLFDGEFILISEDGENLKSRQTPIAFKANGQFWVNNHAHILKGRKPFHNDLMIYYFQNMDLNSYITGAVQPKLNKANLLSIPIYLPEDENEQKAIASMLSSLDDKIDLLHRQNKTLEALAQTLFRQWFVEEAEEGWGNVQLKKVVDIAIGRTPPRKESQWFSTNPIDVKWISIKDLGNDGVFIFKTSEYLTREAVQTFNIPIIPKDTVVLSFKMTVGRVAITAEDMLSNEAIAHFKFDNKTPFTKEFLYLFLKTYQYDLLGSTSSIVTAINSTMIKEMEVVIPDKEKMNRFQEKTEPLFNKIGQNQSQIRILEKLRDTLLPKLMSGEVRVNI